jgi:hypothetical protein
MHFKIQAYGKSEGRYDWWTIYETHSSLNVASYIQLCFERHPEFEWRVLRDGEQVLDWAEAREIFNPAPVTAVIVSWQREGF